MVLRLENQVALGAEQVYVNSVMTEITAFNKNKRNSYDSNLGGIGRRRQRHGNYLDVCGLFGDQRGPHGMGRPHAPQKRPCFSGGKLSGQGGAGGFSESPAGSRVLPDQHRVCDPGAKVWGQGGGHADGIRNSQQQGRPGTGGARGDAFSESLCFLEDAPSWQSASGSAVAAGVAPSVRNRPSAPGQAM